MDINDYFYAWKPALFRHKTRGMTTLQKGIYRELIDEYMITREPLPADDIVLADIARVTLDVWNENKGMILPKFENVDGFLHHEHCNDELSFQDKKSSKRSKSSKKAALKRWEHKKKTIMRNQCESDAKPMRSDATGQDRTGQDINPLTPPPKKNRFEEFWEQYPRQRRGAKDKAEIAYRKAITRDTEESILSGLLSYAASDEVARGFAKGAAAWLNDDRWANDYAVKPQSSKMPNGKPDYFGDLMTAAQGAAHNVKGIDK